MIHIAILGMFTISNAGWAAPVAESSERPLVVKSEGPEASRQAKGSLWKHELYRFIRLLFAPKLEYKVDKLMTFSDGVWAEYTIINCTLRTKYLDTRFLESPLRGIKIVDPLNQQWHIPQDRSWELYGNPDSFVAVQPGMSVAYRAKISSADKSLEVVRMADDKKFKRPNLVRYNIMGWTGAYSKLTNERPKSESMHVFGIGDVPVEWSDKHSPKDWPLQHRLR